jgi:hypothetical protein
MSDAQTIVDCDAKLNWRGASPQDDTIRAGPTDDAASRSEYGGVFRIAIVQKIATVSKRPVSLHGRIPRHLLHLLRVRVIGDPESWQREDLHRQEAGAASTAR